MPGPSASAFAGGERRRLGDLLRNERRPLAGETPPGSATSSSGRKATAGAVSLVDLNEAGEPLPEGGFAGPYDWFGTKTRRAAAGRIDVRRAALHAISPDGSQIVFTEAEEREGAEESNGQLYVRRGIGTSSPESTKISAYQGSASGPEDPAAFLEASTDGRYVFFMSKAALTEDAYAGEAGNDPRASTATTPPRGDLTDLTPDPAEERGDGPGGRRDARRGPIGQRRLLRRRAVLTGEAASGETAWRRAQPLPLDGKQISVRRAAGTKERRTPNWSPVD